jgi:hypothetical protein
MLRKAIRTTSAAVGQGSGTTIRTRFKLYVAIVTIFATTQNHCQGNLMQSDETLLVPVPAMREIWMQEQIARIKAGGTIRQRCVMATEDRVRLGLCLGDLPESRAHRGSHVCSDACQRDRRRLMRHELAKNKCRYCGRTFTRKQREKQEAEHGARV